MPGTRANSAISAGNRAKRRRIAAKLGKERHIRRALWPPPRDSSSAAATEMMTAGNLADQTVADRQDRIGLKGVRRVHAVHENADDQPDHDVQRR